MNQRGFIPIFILIILVAAAGIGLTVGTPYIKQVIQFITLSTPSPSPETPKTTDFDSGFNDLLSSPLPVTQTGTPTVKPKTTTPTKTKTPTPKPTPVPTAATSSSVYNTCSVGVLADSSSQNSVRLAAGATSKNGSYIKAAQWDFDGNGSWDTDMNISNQNITHNFSNGSYTVKLRTQMSDGSTTSSCSQNVSIPSGIQVSLTGTIYEDKNCNDMREPDEKGLSGVRVSITNMDGYATLANLTTDSSGFYSFNYVLSSGNSITVQPYAYPLDNYGVGQFPAHTISLNSYQKSINIDLGEVPSPVYDYCH